MSIIDERSFFSSEKCGIFGAYGKGFEAARVVYFGLWALQHRGQESSGISVSNGKRIKTHKGEGLVAHVYQEKDLKSLQGYIAIGHNRYGTSGGSSSRHAQPVTTSKGLVVLAHNGNLPSVTKLLAFLKEKKIPTKDLNDSALMQRVIEWYLLHGETIESAVKKSYPLFTGAFCLVIMTKDKLVVVRDTYGIRPLCMGKLNGGYVFASETCALDTIQATFLREVRPGEMIVVDAKGLHEYQIEKSQQKLDIFEFIYFARPDSVLLGKSVNEVRRNLGINLAKESYIQADIVIPVPDSAIPAAVGYAQESGIPFEHGLIKNRYIHRTFIKPDQHLRERDIGIKLNPLKATLKGKRVIIVDDSIVRGSTSKKIVKLLRETGVKEIHVLISCPPIKFPDYYGIDTPVQKALIASHRTIEQIRQYVGADTVQYLSYKGMIDATGLPESKFSTSNFNGVYPIDIRERREEIVYPEEKVKQIAVLISNAGTGTNLQAIIDAIESKRLLANIAVVISDKADAYGLVRAKKHHIPIHIFDSKKESLEDILSKEYPVDYIALTGWKKIISNSLIATFPERILNIHPGLIPDTMAGEVKNPDGTIGLWNRGKFTDLAVANFLDTKASYAGSSVHFLSEEFDFGKVLARTFEKIQTDDTIESLYSRLKQKENEIYIDSFIRLCNPDGVTVEKTHNTVVVIDGGGRGAALVTKYSQSPYVQKIIAIPGNDLMKFGSEKPIEIFPHLKTTDVEEIVKICKEKKAALVDVAQDNAVACKLVDLLEEENIPVIGPRWLAGQIEWSKSFARILLLKKGINQPFFRICHSPDEGIAFIKNNPDQPWFVKADGLAEGKGALPARNNEEAMQRIVQMSEFGEAGKVFLIEKWLGGKDQPAEEFSALALTDGKDFQIIGTAQDHKRLSNFDEGDNTGSMGSSSSPLVLTPGVMEDIKDIMGKTLEGLREEGITYKGVLYLSGMLIEEKGKLIPYVIEYNARWGDPEAQVLLPGITNDLFLLSMAIISGNLSNMRVVLDGKVRVAVAGASRGYPKDYSAVKGKEISGIHIARKLPHVQIFSAGIKEVNNKHYASGGRLFYAVGEGKDILEARRHAYHAMSLLSVEGNNLHYRTDIGWRDVERLRE